MNRGSVAQASVRFALGPRRGRIGVALLACLIGAGLGCMRQEAQGSYAVRLEIAGSPRSFEGSLILSTAPLDIPALAMPSPDLDPEGLGADAISANSCFILELPSQAGSQATLVRVFEARISASGEVATPIEIVRSADLSIRIVSLQLFADALGGELEVELAEEVRPGRILGERVGAPRAQQCVEALQALRAAP